jgi:hypothetical protein
LVTSPPSIVENRVPTQANGPKIATARDDNKKKNGGGVG